LELAPKKNRVKNVPDPSDAPPRDVRVLGDILQERGARRVERHLHRAIFSRAEGSLLSQITPTLREALEWGRTVETSGVGAIP